MKGSIYCERSWDSLMAWEVLLRGSRALTIRLVHRPSSQRTKAGLLLLVVVFLVYWRVLLWHNIMTPVF